MARGVVFGLYGAGGFAREVMGPWLDNLAMCGHHLAESDGDVFFVETEPRQRELNGLRVMSEAEFFALDCAEKQFNVAIADSKARQQIAERCIANGARPVSILAPHSITYPHNEIGEGAIICDLAIVTANAKIGRFFHANLSSYVAHDCVIGDFVTFAPGVSCNGNVHIGDHAYLGTGALLMPGSPGKPLVIGEGAVVGMGAVVTKDVSPHTTVVGNPARPHSSS